MKSTIRVKARDTRLPWMPILMVLLITFLAAGCSSEPEPLVLKFDETTEVAAQTAPTMNQVASAVQ